MALSDFDDDAEKVPAGGGGLKPDSMPDGEYVVKVTEAKKKDLKTKATVVEMKLEVLTDGVIQGKKFDHSYWVVNGEKDGEPAKVNENVLGILKKELETMGFDQKNWKKENGRPFAKEFDKALLVIPGMHLKIKKTTNGKYHNIAITGRDAGDGKLTEYGEAELNKALEESKTEIPF